MVYTNLKAKESDMHGMFESSLMSATDIGRIFDVIVRDESEKAIAVDNGVPVKLGSYTGNGLQERYATIAKATDAIAVIGSPAEVKTAMTNEQGQAYHFVNAAGKPAKAYQVNDSAVYEEIFAVASYQFTDESAKNVKVGSLVVTDGKGMYVAQADGTELSTLTSTNGFIGQIHSVSVGTYYTMIRIQVLQNKDVA